MDYKNISPINLNQNKGLKNQVKIEKEKINHKLPLWNTFSNVSVGYLDVDNVEEIFNKPKQRGRAMSYIHENPKLITI